MAYTLDFSLALGSSKTGLTMAAQLVDTTGTNTGSEITSGFAEIGQGFYQWHYAAFADSFRGGVKFYEDGQTGTILGFAAINPEEAENADAKTSTRSTLAQSDILDDATPFSGADIDAAISTRSTLAAADILTTALTESYAADGAEATLSQLVYMLWAYMRHRERVGTTITVDELDSATPAMTFTLDDASTPTTHERAT